MRIYLASSWRNESQPDIVLFLRALGHEVYDFRNPAPGDVGFSWKSCAKDWQLKDPEAFRDSVLTSAPAVHGFELDMNALKTSEVTILLLPCGRSAHLELGYAAGMGQKTIVYLDTPMSEPELMYLMNTRIVCSVKELGKALYEIREGRL